MAGNKADLRSLVSGRIVKVGNKYKKGFTLSSFVNEDGRDGVFEFDNLQTRSYSVIKSLLAGSASRAKRKLDRVYS